MIFDKHDASIQMVYPLGKKATSCEYNTESLNIVLMRFLYTPITTDNCTIVSSSFVNVIEFEFGKKIPKTAYLASTAYERAEITAQRFP